MRKNVFSRQNILFVVLFLAFFLVMGGGCGGGSSGGGDAPTPTPTPTPTPDDPVTTATIEGEWKIESGKYTATHPDASPIGSATYVGVLQDGYDVFEIETSVSILNADRYSMKLIGDGTVGDSAIFMKFENDSDGSEYHLNLSALHEFEKISESNYFWDMYNPTVPHNLPGSSASYILLDDDTLQYNMITITDILTAEVTVILKRVE